MSAQCKPVLTNTHLFLGLWGGVGLCDEVPWMAMVMWCGVMAAVWQWEGLQSMSVHSRAMLNKTHVLLQLQGTLRSYHTCNLCLSSSSSISHSFLMRSCMKHTSQPALALWFAHQGWWCPGWLRSVMKKIMEGLLGVRIEGTKVL